MDCQARKSATHSNIYVFEFKLDKPAQEALDQINSKDYALPFSVDGRKLFKVGVSFSSETRKVAEWVMGEETKQE